MNITICNFKGGVGKSLIAHQLITSFGFDGVEIDPYGSLAERLPDKVIKVDLSQRVLKKFKNTIFDFGGFNDIKIEQAIKQSQLIIIPFNATIETLQSTIDTVNIIKEFDKPILFVANMVQKAEDIEEVNVIIQDVLGFECEIFIMPVSVAYQTAINRNVSILELANAGGLKAFAYKKASANLLELKTIIDTYVYKVVF
ncbi:MAG: ParA family protein [Sulfurovum sp.]|jgi:chromosome partitioning protein|nr:MAG: ParA family protein [Sulfurovum sp.]